MSLQPKDQLPVNTGALDTQFKDICTIWSNEKTECTIYKATHRLDGCTYAIKKIKIPEELETDTHKNLDDCFQELQILTKFSHPNIVKYHNSWIEEEKLKEKENSEENQGFSVQIEKKNIQFLYIKMEFCTGTSLATYVQKNELTPQKAKEIFIQILQGMKEVHSQNVIHRDLKPDNIFVDEEGKKVKIGDFGLSSMHGLEADGRSDGPKLQSEQQIRSNVYNRSDDSNLLLSPSAQSRVSEESDSSRLRFSEQSESNNRIVGTPLYCSPEQQAGKEYGKETDIFALGLIFYQILCFPKASDMEKSKLFAALREELDLAREFEAQFPVEASIVKSMAYFYPSKRAKIEEVLLKLTGVPNNPVENIPSVPIVVNIMKEKEEKKEEESEGIFCGKGQAHIWVKVEGIENTIKIENGITSNVLAGGNRNKGRKLCFKYQTKDHKGQPIDPIFVKYLD